ncbi:MAG TPA: monofunctional biosynthetic peptidoglycan transglycosylase [Nevskiaceae bacterium]|nr:monofunctional biosynthetic peptidoglycan transglycosylase [Nevskiaceae bacterium]
MDLNPANLYPERRRRVVDDEPPPMPTRGKRSLFKKILLILLALAIGTTLLPVGLLRFVPAWTSSFMVRYQFERLTSEKKMPALRHDWVSWDEIAPAAKIAVIAAEDQKFPDHFGFDLEAIEKARAHNQSSRRKRGASTISQQTAKNLFLWPGRSWTRKGLEVGYTVLLEAMWPKRRILEVYLNVAEFGVGVYGVEAAAQAYFRKPASKLTHYEAALLAAVLPNPRRFKVAAPSGYVQSRASDISGQMRQLGTDYIRGL